MVSDGLLRLACSGLDPVRLDRLLGRAGTPERIAASIAAGTVRAPPAIRRGAAVPAATRRNELDAAGVQAVGRADAGFPTVLTEHPDAPHVLFVRGEPPPTPGVAIVGTRRCTSYGLRLAQDFGLACASAGYTVVSGLARGIDGAAHGGTCDGEGRGIAVLGSGLDVWYPAEHRPLGERLIAGGGAVISEYPLGSPPEPWRFPLRNRIIAGLAAAVVVVEAGVTGGALITASAALERAIPVFSVPGDVGREASVGCNLLIRDGAIPVLGADDLLEGLSLLPGLVGAARSAGTVRSGNGDHWLLASIPASGISIDDLSAAVDTPAGDVVAELTRLQTAGAVKVEAGRVHLDAAR